MVYFLKLHLNSYLRDKFQVSSVTLTSFRQGGRRGGGVIYPPPPRTPQNESLKSPPRTTFSIWNFYFGQILSGIVEKQHVLTSFDLFFKFSHCLTLFSIFSVHVNWILICVTRDLFKYIRFNRYYTKYVT